jgi:4'-phosphopantetheinyl transferase
MSSSSPFAWISSSSVNGPPAEDIPRGAPPSDGTIDLWHGSLRHTGWRDLLQLLSDEEHRRADAFAFDRDARRFVVSHAVLRTLLGRFTGVPACKLKFRAERAGKPVLEAGMGQSVHFSLSRSEEVVLIGLASGPLGVDIEWLAKPVDTEALGDFVLSRRERAAFRRLDPGDRQRAFLQCWIQKEAYLKAIGQGLHVSPATVEVSLDPDQAVGLKSIAGDWRAAARWYVDIITPREGYIGAVAILGDRRQVQMTAFDTSRLLVREIGEEPGAVRRS